MQNRPSIGKTKLSSDCIFRLTREGLSATKRCIENNMSSRKKMKEINAKNTIKGETCLRLSELRRKKVEQEGKFGGERIVM